MAVPYPKRSFCCLFLWATQKHNLLPVDVPRESSTWLGRGAGAEKLKEILVVEFPKIALRNFPSLSMVVIFWFIICCFLRTWEKKFLGLAGGMDNENGKLFIFEEIFCAALFAVLSLLANHKSFTWNAANLFLCLLSNGERKKIIFVILKTFFHYFYSCRVLGPGFGWLDGILDGGKYKRNLGIKQDCEGFC